MKRKHVANNSKALHEELGRLAALSKEIADASEGRDMTNSERAEIHDVVAAFNETETRIRALRVESSFDEMSRPMSRLAQPDDLPEARARRPARTFTGGSPSAPKDSWGWSGPGEFTKAVFNASRGAPHPRLLNAASTYGSEGLNEDGGFAVHPDFRANILSLIQGDDSLMALCALRSAISSRRSRTRSRSRSTRSLRMTSLRACS